MASRGEVGPGLITASFMFSFFFLFTLFLADFYVSFCRLRVYQKPSCFIELKIVFHASTVWVMFYLL